MRITTTTCSSPSSRCATAGPSVPLDACGADPWRASADAYGLELFVRRTAPGLVGGWASYTLADATARDRFGQSFEPAFDVRHVANAVLELRLGSAVRVSLRLHARTGRLERAFVFDPSGQPRALEVRLPTFERVDAGASYTWRAGPANVSLAIEWLNVTLAREPVGLECTLSSCVVERAPAVFYPNAAVRAAW